MITLYLLGKKGLNVLTNITPSYYNYISRVVIGNDKSVVKDYSNEIEAFCIENKLSFMLSNTEAFISPFALAIGWRHLISYNTNQQLIVFHDSILPRLRGFNPLVTALINGDEEIGVTALFAKEEYDRGDIIDVEKIKIEYPIKIKEAISDLSKSYAILANRILEKLVDGGDLESVTQDEVKATYSLWRDSEDYRINWEDDAHKIARHIDAVGFPYNGAQTTLNNKVIRINDSIPIEDVVIENRVPGKVIFKKENNPVVVCGKGLLLLLEVKNINNEKIDFSKKFRMRFK